MNDDPVARVEAGDGNMTAGLAEGSVGSLAARGAVAMGLRQVFVWIVSFAGGVILARLLEPADFGIYAIAVFILGAFVMFGDGGLGASLIRQDSEPTLFEYRAVFTVQQLIVTAAVLGCVASASLIVEIYGLRSDYAWFIRLTALAFLVSSFQTISSTRLERRLAFDKIGVASAAGSLVFNVTAVGLAFAGAGVYSFGVGLLADAATTTLLLIKFAPWKARLVRPDAGIRSRLRFGIPYQGVTVVSLVKDSISPVLIGLLLGAASVGYVRWATSLAAYALLALMVLQRVLMPTFARLQSDRVRLGSAIESVLQASNAVVAPVAMVTLAFAEPITRLVFGDKWLPALDVFYLFWLANLVVPTAVPIMALLNALGRSDLTLRFAVVWMLATWALGAPLVSAAGIVGFGVANVLVQLTTFALVRVAQKEVPFRAFSPGVRPWILAAAACAAPYTAAQLLAPADDLIMLMLYGVASGTLYLALLWHFHRDDVQRLARLLGLGWPLRRKSSGESVAAGGV